MFRPSLIYFSVSYYFGKLELNEQYICGFKNLHYSMDLLKIWVLVSWNIDIWLEEIKIVVLREASMQESTEKLSGGQIG